jgi:hypothetical protein
MHESLLLNSQDDSDISIKWCIEQYSKRFLENTDEAVYSEEEIYKVFKNIWAETFPSSQKDTLTDTNDHQPDEDKNNDEKSCDSQKDVANVEEVKSSRKVRSMSTIKRTTKTSSS